MNIKHIAFAAMATLTLAGVASAAEIVTITPDGLPWHLPQPGDKVDMKCFHPLGNPVPGCPVYGPVARTPSALSSSDLQNRVDELESRVDELERQSR
jgi:hypothetical protein